MTPMPSPKRLPGRGPFRAVLFGAALVALGFLVGCGDGNDGSEAVDGEGAAEKREEVASPFSDLEPSAGDVLVPPEIGFRWHAVSEEAGDPPLFRLNLVDSLGAIYGRRTTTESAIRLELPPETPPGTYSWWVEVLAPGDSSVVSRSDRETFEIRVR